MAVAAAAPEPATPSARAVYDYEATEDNEISFTEGDLITELEEVDEGWWSGKAPNGQVGLFPSNYVERVGGEEAAYAEPEPEPAYEPEPEPVHAAAAAAPPAPAAALASEGVVKVAMYAYAAAEDNEISFEEGDRLTNVDTSIDDDWWQGELNGVTGLFPSAYVVDPEEYAAAMAE